MARTVCTYGALDLNDGVSYFLLPGFNAGEKLLTYDEVLGFDGTAAQVNVSRASFVTMTVPLRVQGTSEANLRALVDAINTKVDAGEQTLVYGPGDATTNYACVASPNVGYPCDDVAKITFSAFVIFNPRRTP